MMKLVVLSCLLAAASAVVPLLGIGAIPYTLGGIGNYRGPLSLAPGQPANILGLDGRPLDTLDVNLDRSAHLIARATAGHILKKRSVVPISPLITPTLPITYGARLSPLTVPTLGFGGVAPITTYGTYGRIATPLIY